jgi:glycosyltransferase involved in cell wall biosynthesis
MRIGVNTRLFVKGKMDGIAWVAYEILKRIVVQHPEHEFIFFFDRPYNPYFIFAPNVKPVIVSPQARHPFLWYLFFETGIKKALKKEKIDLFISPDGWVCLHTNVKTINVIHDLNFEHYPSFFSPVIRKYLTYFFPRFAKKADHLITVSQFSKNDIIDMYNIDKDKISIVYNAAADDFFEVDEQTKKETVQRFTNGVSYFVFAGSNKYWDKEIKKTYNQLKHKSDIVLTGYLSTTEMNCVLSSAVALVYTSLFEGFGIPIVEGFAACVPVITSNVTSMPEVAGEAALLVNPLSVEEIVNAMEKMAEDEQLRATFVQRGKERYKIFSWDISAQQFWNVIQEFCK